MSGQTNDPSQNGPTTSSATSSSTISSATSSVLSSTSSLTTNSSIAPSTTPQITSTGSPHSSSSGNLSAATVAGAAVGAAVGGALLAFLLTFMLMRRRRQEKPRQTHRHSEKRHTFGGAKALLPQSDDDFVDAKHAWEKHLPQPADDSSIQLTIKTLLHQVELHVENFYTDSAASTTLSEEVQTELLKLDSPFLPKSVTVLLPQARSKTALIKHCLAQLVVSNITTEGNSATGKSFLPWEFVALPQTLSRTRSDSKKPAFAQSLSRWRVLTSYLRPTPPSDPDYIAARDSAIATAAGTFCTAFSPWSSRAHNHAARFQNLTTIMQSAADAGIMIFAQPASFSWVWTVGGNARGKVDGGREIVVTPGLVKVTDDDAKALERPQVMVQQVVHGL